MKSLVNPPYKHIKTPPATSHCVASTTIHLSFCFSCILLYWLSSHHPVELVKSAKNKKQVNSKYGVITDSAVFCLSCKPFHQLMHAKEHSTLSIWLLLIFVFSLRPLRMHWDQLDSTYAEFGTSVQLNLTCVLWHQVKALGCVSQTSNSCNQTQLQ